jgi:hypothetical protein
MGSSEPKAPRPAYVEEADEDGNVDRSSRRSARKKEGKEKSKPKVSYRSRDDKKQSKSDSGVEGSGYPTMAMMSGARQDDDAMSPRDVKIERRRSSAGTSSKSKRYDTKSPSKSKVDESKYYGIPKSQPIPTTMAQPAPQRPRPSLIASQSYPARPLSYHAAFGAPGHGPPISNQPFWQHQAATSHYPPLAPSATFIPNAPPPSEYLPSPSPLAASRSLNERFGQPQRTGSGFGFRDPIIQQRLRDDYDDGGYTSTTESGQPRASIRTLSNRKIIRTQAEMDYDAMPPPARPASARPGPSILRRSTEYAPDVVTAPEPEFRDRGSRIYRDESAPRRSSVSRHSGVYELGDRRVEAANSGRRRQSYYGQSASNGSGASGASGWEDKAARAASYQDGVSGSAVPLTADMLRRQQRRQGGSSRSTKSSGSRDESDYRKSATTRTTRSVSSPEDENVTIKVVGQARVTVGGAQIDYNDGGEIEIKRQKSVRGSDSVRGGSEWSNSEYGGDHRRTDDRRTSRIDKPAGHSRRRSVSYARAPPQFAHQYPPQYAPQDTFF